MKTADIQKLVVKFKLMYVAGGRRNKSDYLVKFKEYLGNIHKILTTDITQGQVKVLSCDVLPQDFITDDQNDTTLIYLQTDVELSGDFKRIQTHNPEYTNHLVEFIDEWLGNFNIDAPASKPKTKRKKKK